MTMNRSTFLKTMAAGAIGLAAGGALRGTRAEADGKAPVVSCFGDSTTWGANGMASGGGNEIAWPAQLHKYMDVAKVYNFGKKGSRLAVTEDRNDSFVERLSSVLAQPADVILLLGGVNDFQHDVPLGKPGDTDTTTVCGAMETILTGLLTQFPTAQLVVMTPMKERFQHPTKNYPDSFTANGQGLVEEDYAKAIAACAARYSVPVIDLFNGSGISPFLEAQQKKYMPDGLHYSPEGYDRLAKRIAAGLEAIWD